MTPREQLVTVKEGAPKEEVLALLHKHRAHATFFVLGKCAKQWPQLVQQAARLVLERDDRHDRAEDLVDRLP